LGSRNAIALSAAVAARSAFHYALVLVRPQAGLQWLWRTPILVTGDTGVLRLVLAKALVGEEYMEFDKNSEGRKVSDILKRKKASIKRAPLPSGSPEWDTFMQMTWEQVEEGARTNRPGFKVVRKLLTDKRFDK
jgi:hypothetical protein